MRAVWSFWTKPFKEHHRDVWFSERHHLLSWALSFETARKHYPETALITDDEGAELLVHGLGLPFQSVSTELSELRDSDPVWWVLGKLRAYGQEQPFVHIDNDVFLWARLPHAVETAAVFAQNPESFTPEPDSWYRPEHFTRGLRELDGWMPEEWLWSADQGRCRAICCGILGGNDTDFIQRYARLATEMIMHARNRRVWEHVGATTGDNILFEQYLLAACLDFRLHTDRIGASEPRVRFLFESSSEAFDESAAARVGYTHLIGGAKKNATLARRLEKRVSRDYPVHYDRCCCLTRSPGYRVAQ